MNRAPRVLVVGGGISGLAHAWELQRRGTDVLALEESDWPGGVIRTLRKDGYLLELGPNTVRPNAEILRICRELAIEPQMRLSNPRLPRYVQIDGRLKKIPFPAISVAGAVRAAADLFARRGAGGPEESVFDFVCRHFGREVAENLVEPFVSGIFAGDARRLSVEAAFPRLAGAERARGSVIRGMLASRKPAAPGRKKVRGLLSFADGLSALPRALAASLRDRFRAGIRVEKIERVADGWAATTSEGYAVAERVVLATPAAEASRLCGPFAPEAARALAEIPSPPLRVAHCSWERAQLRRGLEGFGHLVRPRDGRKLLGAVWSSALFAGRAPQGRALLTIFLGGRRTPELADLDGTRLAQVIFEETAEVLGATAPPEIVHSERYERSIPQYEIGHRDRLRRIEEAEAAHPGLYFLGNYRGGISVGDTTESSVRAAV
jgi:oxygen-dependent protoporphyrinogen oxidase